jgi:hypothetical protein
MVENLAEASTARQLVIRLDLQIAEGAVPVGEAKVGVPEAHPGADALEDLGKQLAGQLVLALALSGDVLMHDHRAEVGLAYVSGLYHPPADRLFEGAGLRRAGAFGEALAVEGEELGRRLVTVVAGRDGEFANFGEQHAFADLPSRQVIDVGVASVGEDQTFLVVPDGEAIGHALESGVEHDGFVRRAGGVRLGTRRVGHWPLELTASPVGEDRTWRLNVRLKPRFQGAPLRLGRCASLSRGLLAEIAADPIEGRLVGRRRAADLRGALRPTWRRGRGRRGCAGGARSGG